MIQVNTNTMSAQTDATPTPVDATGELFSQAQRDNTIIGAMFGAGEFITIDSFTGEKAMLIAGKNTNIDSENGSAILHTQNADGDWVFALDLHVQSTNAEISFFYEDDYVYIGFITQFDGRQVFRAMMDGTMSFTQIYVDDVNYELATVTNIDSDGDGDEDFLFAGANRSTNVNSTNGVLRNDGNGIFTLTTAPPEIPPMNWGTYKSAYLDDSGLQHLIVVDDTFAAIFENDGNGNFTNVFTLNNVPTSPRITVGDMNNNLSNDIIIPSSIGTTVYRNIGNLDFLVYESAYTQLPDVRGGEISLIQIDDDGLADVVVTGLLVDGTVITKLIMQSDNLKFMGNQYYFLVQDEFPQNPDIILPLAAATVTIYDANNDGQDDVLFTGNLGGGPGPASAPRTYLMINTSTLSVDDSIIETFGMYPNPVVNTLHINNINTIDIRNIIIVNITGQTMFRTNSFTSNIDVSTYGSGVYIMTIESVDGRIFQEKLVKN